VKLGVKLGVKFGCIAPSVIQLPWDLHALLPEDVQALTVTLNVRNGLPGEHERALANMQRAADVLIDEGAKAIVVMGVPVAARRGFAPDRAALDALTADRGAIPIISSLAAAALALGHLGAKRPLFITQYNAEVNAAIVAYCRDAGVDAAGIVGLGAGNAAQVNALSVADYDALTRRALDEHRDADGIFLSARGNLLSLSRELETKLRLPVVEQVQASVWWALTELGVELAGGLGLGRKAIA
jgi:maleate cis-trans isomerase